MGRHRSIARCDARSCAACESNGSAGEGMSPSTKAAIVKPRDDGYLTERPSRKRLGSSATRNPNSAIRNSQKRKPLRASARSPGDATLVCAPGHHHPRDGIHRDSRKHGTRRRAASRSTGSSCGAPGDSPGERDRRKMLADRLANADARTPSLTNTPANPSAPPSRTKSPPNSSAPKSPAAAPSSPPTSTIPNSSR